MSNIATTKLSSNPSSRMRVVLDTNVLMSGIFFARPPATILAAWAEGELELLASVDILRSIAASGHASGIPDAFPRRVNGPTPTSRCDTG